MMPRALPHALPLALCTRDWHTLRSPASILCKGMLDGLAVSSFQVCSKSTPTCSALYEWFFLSPVSCASISDGCLQGSNDANWVLHCTNVVLCVVPASSSAAKQQTLQLINKLRSQFSLRRFYDFYSALSWAAKRMPKPSCFHERISPAVGPVNFCIVHRLLICNVVLQTTWLDQRQSIVCVCLIDCARSRM